MDIRTPIPTNAGDLLERCGEIWRAQIEAAQAKFAAVIEEVRMPGTAATDLPTLYIQKESIAAVLEYFKSDPACDYSFMSDITATDEEADPRFEVVYHLLSQAKGCRIRLKVRVKDGDSVPTACGVWPATNWAEREIWDMFGVRFEGHPDLRRILMDERWVGHPLRKDYPLRGYQIFTEPMKPKPELLD